MVFRSQNATGIFVFAGPSPVEVSLASPLKTWPMLNLIETALGGQEWNDACCQRAVYGGDTTGSERAEEQNRRRKELCQSLLGFWP